MDFTEYQKEVIRLRKDKELKYKYLNESFYCRALEFLSLSNSFTRRVKDIFRPDQNPITEEIGTKERVMLVHDLTLMLRKIALVSEELGVDMQLLAQVDVEAMELEVNIKEDEEDEAF